MTQTNTKTSLRTRINLPMEQAIEKVTDALKEEGFGILTEIDVKSTFKRSLTWTFVST